VDHPRFERIRGRSDDLHLAYHGGTVVELVLRLVDRWLIKHTPARPAQTVQPSLGEPADPDIQPHRTA
jgi:hypothetical protein